MIKQNHDFSKPLKAVSTSVTSTHTQQSSGNLINLYEAWRKPEQAEEWREKLALKDAVEE